MVVAGVLAAVLAAAAGTRPLPQWAPAPPPATPNSKLDSQLAGLLAEAQRSGTSAALAQAANVGVPRVGSRVRVVVDTGGGAQAAVEAAIRAQGGAVEQAAPQEVQAVDPRGASTSYYFEYGPTRSYGRRMPSVDAGLGITSVVASANLSALDPGVTYRHRLVASNGSGSSYGQDAAFTTLAWAARWPAVAPFPAVQRPPVPSPPPPVQRPPVPSPPPPVQRPPAPSPPPAPTNSRFTPTSGPVGQQVTISGSSLTGATTVAFNGTDATSYTVDSDSQITATVPANATSGPVTVTTPGGTATSSSSFTVTGAPSPPAPTISGFTPTSGPVGQQVTIAGNNLTGATTVAFNGTDATSYAVDSDSQITATVPTGTTSGTITVTTPGGTATSTSSFTVTYTVSASASTLTPTNVAPFTISGTVAPAAAGQTVNLQLNSAGTWTTVASQALTATSGYQFTVTPGLPGAYSYRVSMPASGSTAAGTSAALQIQVSAATVLDSGQILGVDQYLVSSDGRYRLTMQGDGNLVLTLQADGRVIWASGTVGHNGARLFMQGDGNLVIYDPANAVLWNAGTAGHAGAWFQVQVDANLVVYGPGSVALWASYSADSQLASGERLASGQSIMSPSRYYRLVMQTDGNLVIYNGANAVIWNSGTQGNSGAWVSMQTDGNLVVYTASNQALWSSGTQGHSGAHLIMQDDGNLVIYNGPALWSTNTAVGGGGATAAETAAVNWAKGWLDNTSYDGRCLAFVFDAYQRSAAGLNLRLWVSPQPSDWPNTYPSDIWHNFTHGTTHVGADPAPPYGALVFFQASGPDHTTSHVAISIGGGYVYSTKYGTKSGVHIQPISSFAPELGWWLPDQ